jgi:hypothetical protein
MHWVGLLYLVLFYVVVVGLQAAFITYFMTAALRQQRGYRTSRRWRTVLLISAAAWSLVVLAMTLESRPWDRQEWPLWGGFIVLILIASLVAEWGITDKPSLPQRAVRCVIRRPISG